MFGIVPTSQLFKLRKILFRISRENLLIRTANLYVQPDELVDKWKEKEDIYEKDKSIIFLLFPKTNLKTIEGKIMHCLETFEFKQIEISTNDQKNTILE